MGQRKSLNPRQDLSPWPGSHTGWRSNEPSKTAMLTNSLSVAQWLESLTGIWEVMGSNPFFFVPLSFFLISHNSIFYPKKIFFAWFQAVKD